jgi:uracil-DNA glycosylase
MPMGFCYPGRNLKGSGDAKPREECAPQWHDEILSNFKDLKLKLIIGQYAIKAYLGGKEKRNLTETVKSFEEYLPQFFPLVHPSPLNFRWHSKNPWFEREVIPILQKEIKTILNKSVI